MPEAPQPETNAKYYDVVGDTVEAANSTLSAFDNKVWMNGGRRITSPNQSWIVQTQTPTYSESGGTEPTDAIITLTISPPKIDT